MYQCFNFSITYGSRFLRYYHHKMSMFVDASQPWARYLEGDNISTKIGSGRVEIEIGEASPIFWQIGIGIGIGEASPIFWQIGIEIGEASPILLAHTYKKQSQEYFVSESRGAPFECAQKWSGRGCGGQVVSVLTFYSDDLSLNPS